MIYLMYLGIILVIWLIFLGGHTPKKNYHNSQDYRRCKWCDERITLHLMHKSDKQERWCLYDTLPIVGTVRIQKYSPDTCLSRMQHDKNWFRSDSGRNHEPEPVHPLEELMSQ